MPETISIPKPVIEAVARAIAYARFKRKKRLCPPNADPISIEEKINDTVENHWIEFVQDAEIVIETIIKL
jgi:hypothetical protein